MWQEHRQTCVLDARQQRAYHTKEGIEGRPHLSNHLSPSSRTTNVTGEFLGSLEVTYLSGYSTPDIPLPPRSYAYYD